MSFGEILRPDLNPWEQNYRRYVYEATGGMSSEWILEKLRENNVLPNTHRKVLDLCTGDGSIPAILIENGWKAKGITCVDQFESPTPLVKGVSWKYFDISSLVWAIRTGKEISRDVLQMRSKFDLVTLFHSFEGADINQEACNFFVRPGGYTLCQ